MAINTTVYDLEDYPENSKTITLDLLKVVPVGAQGDEKFLLTCKTNAYSDFTNKTSIDGIFIQEFLCGWSKSSGFKGAVFTITSSDKELAVSIDSISSTLDIALEEGTNLTGDVIAADIQTKLRDKADLTGDPAENKLGHKNCRCSFVNSRFVIKSGTISKLLSGSGASSVVVTAASSNDVSVKLGFDLPVESLTLAGTDIREVVVSSPYTSGTSPISVESGLSFSAGDSMYITDGTNFDYFTAVSGTDTSVEVAIAGVHGFDGISHTYATGSKVQKLKYNDPEYKPVSCLESVDDALTWGILSLANQIDYSG